MVTIYLFTLKSKIMRNNIDFNDDLKALVK